jgi:hypothetical protein
MPLIVTRIMMKLKKIFSSKMGSLLPTPSSPKISKLSTKELPSKSIVQVHPVNMKLPENINL